MKKADNLSTPRQKAKKFSRKNSIKSQDQGSSNMKQYNLETRSTLNKPLIKSHKNIQTFDNQFFRKLVSSSYIKMNSNLKLQTTNSPVKQKIRKEQSLDLKTTKKELKEHNVDIDVVLNKYDILMNKSQENVSEIKKQQIYIKNLTTQLDKLTIQNYQLKQEKDLLFKQNKSIKEKISFLQKFTDDKTKDMQSYRQLYLEQQMQKLRAELKLGKNQVEKVLEQQLRKVKEQKYVLERHFQAVKTANQCLLKQIGQYQKENRQIIISSIQYIALREKYKRLLRQYSKLHNEYELLKTQITASNSNTSSDIISMSITLTDFDDSISKNYIS